MTLMELRAKLEAGGAVYGRHFTIGGLGKDVYGIEFVDGAFCTYRSEHWGSYRKTEYAYYTSEADACAALEKKAVAAAKADGVWRG